MILPFFCGQIVSLQIYDFQRLDQLTTLEPSKTVIPNRLFSAYAIKVFGYSMAHPLLLRFEHFFAHKFIPRIWKHSFSWMFFIKIENL